MIRLNRSIFHLRNGLVTHFKTPNNKSNLSLSNISSYSTMRNRRILKSRIQDDWYCKIIYNDVLFKKERIERMRETEYPYTVSKTKAPLILKYLLNDDSNSNNNDNGKVEEKVTESTEVQFPFECQSDAIKQLVGNIADDKNLHSNSNTNFEDTENYDLEIKRARRMKIDYEPEHRWFRSEPENHAEIWYRDYRFGTADANIPVSSVPCGGCGALFHCVDMSIPGFLPKEVFVCLSKTNLMSYTCQRCLFLQEYDIALDVTVNPKEYTKILSRIKNQRALVILVVDLLDFPCSIWHRILDVIGSHSNVFIVGNKIDLIIQDGTDYETHIKECLKNAAEDVGLRKLNVKEVLLVSAKTGYGIENLISTLHTSWGTRGDVYIVGCTNAGKSTLFNALIQSDYCKVQAVDLLKRATVSIWPGTTMNLLKFPILKFSSWRHYFRRQRLKSLEQEQQTIRNYQRELSKATGNNAQISLMGYIGRTFRNQTEEHSEKLMTLNTEDPAFKYSKWCYDTPGVMHEDQILNLLTTAELSKTLPKETIIPRNFELNSGKTLFIGGLARLDFIEGYNKVWFTVFASAELPVTITNTEDADYIYEKLLGTELFAVPVGSDERMRKWPPLMPKDLEVCGITKDIAASDVVMSSAGWVAVTVRAGYVCKLRCWTPNARGIHERTPALIRNSSSYKGNRIFGTPAFSTSLTVM